MPPSKKKMYFIISIIIFIPILYFLIINPSRVHIKKISSQIQAQKKMLENLYLQGQLLQLTQKQYKKVENQKNQISKIYFIKNEELDLITALEKTASKNNISQEINLEEPKKEGKNQNKYQILSLKIKANGAYENFIKYLTDLEALDYYININDLRIFSYQKGNFIIIDNKPAEGNVNVLINADVFRKK